MYSLDAIGKCLGMNEADAAESVEQFMELRERAGLSNAGIVKGRVEIHSVQ